MDVAATGRNVAGLTGLTLCCLKFLGARLGSSGGGGVVVVEVEVVVVVEVVVDNVVINQGSC